MKTHIKNLLLLLLLLGLPGVVQAQDAYSTNADGSIYTYSTNADGSANIVAYAGPPWVVTIPTNINGLTVTSIGDEEYGVLSASLINVTIPDSVTNIFTGSFLNDSLTAITVDTNNPAYSSLNGVLFDKSQTTLIQYPIGLRGSYVIPSSVTSIGELAFYGDFQGNLTSVTIPDSVTNIGGFAFQECIGFANITIPDSVTSIGEAAFDFDQRLTSVTIPNSVTSIGAAAFNDDDILTVITVDTNNPAYSSAHGVLFNNTQTTLIQYPEHLGGSYTIPGSVTSIGDAAFEDTGLTSVTIPNSVTSIGDYAFSQGYSLTKVYFTGNAPFPTNDSTVFYGDPTTAYYLPGTTGWGATFDGLLSAPWFLPTPQILNNGPGFGVQPGGFGFTISWATNASVVVQAATNLATPVWLPVCTNTLTGGTNYFSDPQWRNYLGRFYRVTSTSTPTFPGFTGNLDVDMYNAAVADGTANGGVPAVMLTENGGPFRVTAVGTYSVEVFFHYSQCVLTIIVGTTSCSSTTLPNGSPAIQFGTPLECGSGPYGY